MIIDPITIEKSRRDPRAKSCFSNQLSKKMQVRIRGEKDVHRARWLEPFVRLLFEMSDMDIPIPRPGDPCAASAMSGAARQKRTADWI